MSVNHGRHWQRPEFYPVGFAGDALHFIRMAMANAVGGNVVSETVVSTLVVVVVIVVVVVGTLVILDVLIVVSSGISDVFASLDVARVVNCTILPYILVVATAAFRRGDGAATPTAQRRRQRG